MKILVINCGSSSLKYQLIDMTNEDVLVKGLVERIGIEGSRIKHEKKGMDAVLIEEKMEDHKRAIQLVLEALIDKNHGAVNSMSEISAVGHRVVHGGEEFNKSALLNDKVMAGIKECIDLAPLHNPANIMGIEACKALMPDTPMAAVFDTAFHQTMPAENYIYALPYEYYEKYKIRRYGFHGTSHRFVSAKAAEMLNKNEEGFKVITCHLGNGSSLAAVKGGKCVDTSMGLTPLEGLVMGTRSGDLDPAILPFIMNKEKLSADEMSNILNKKSGVFGISGVSSDFRDIEKAASEGNKRASLALDVFCTRVRKYIASYAAQLGGVDAVVFTAGIGENSIELREKICSGLEFLGVEIDSDKNKVRGKAAEVNKPSSKVKVLVIPTNEELMIAKDTMSLLK
ncbi:acetate/propionate family kinase [Treponema pedis]|uniref:Acetate kinase n=1 Tax=Treponema pedis str. T A4 TaxID=1291379 RepID=S5ZP21_9SPIR|nr:acetate kinase [Treponema pedis]AGT44372.1 acetate kinase [Treponema pedis str. T A4]QSI05064.1 acetate kinase [Treponema pedis]